MYYDYTPAGYLTQRPKTEIQFWTQSFVSGFDPTGLYSGYLSARDNTAYMRDYLRHTGLDWGDIKYPSRTVGFSGGASAGRVVNMISRNIGRLYR